MPYTLLPLPKINTCVTSPITPMSPMRPLALFRLSASSALLALGMLMARVALASARGDPPPPPPPPSVPQLARRFGALSYNHGFGKYYGESNIHLIRNGSYVTIALNKTTGAGLASDSKFYYGFFSAAMKLPAGYTSGVVVAFYMSNSDVYPHNHDEIDFELLGHETGRRWALQTNIYGNGSVSTGREEKFYLWFDPTLDYHHYSIIWNSHHIVFLVDDIPIREAAYSARFASVYPSKPMSVYATIWDGSEWATSGGKYPVDYKYAPFVASFGDMVMDGCKLDPGNSNSTAQPCSRKSVSDLDPVGGEEFVKLSEQQAAAMSWARQKLMFYSYCKDVRRFKVMPAECGSK
uniref:Xyloglucan endotransglucosylase/hydrolase n=1 Tax=Kalanchoe fedtschenkoi TaxID=63787 RepID=A0A7N0U0W7_KALFE